MGRYSRKIRVGIIGCGEVTEFKHLPSLSSQSEIQVAGLADTDRARARRVAEKFGIKSWCRDYQQLLEDDSLQAVAVCTPPEAHVPVALAALDSGKHVLVEKPLALDPAQAELLEERARTAPQQVMMGFHMRFHRIVRQGRARLGELGRIESVRSTWNSPRLDSDLPAWRFHRSSGGGALIEIGVHHFDLWRYLTADEIVEVSAYSRSGTREDESAVVAGRTASGILLSAHLSERAPNACEIDICGSSGRLILDCLRFDGVRLDREGEISSSPGRRLSRLAGTLPQLYQALLGARSGGDYIGSYAAEWRHFAAALRGETTLQSVLTDGVEALRIVRACLASIDSGRPVHLEAGAPFRVSL